MDINWNLRELEPELMTKMFIEVICWMSDDRCGLSVVGYQLSDVGCGLSVVGFRLWVVGCGLWVIEYSFEVDPEKPCLKDGSINIKP